MIESPFLLPPEVDKISRLSDLTRWRLEKSGRFPKREAWVADPQGWAGRHDAQPGVVG